MLFDTLGPYFSINAAGNPTWAYKFCAAVLAPLQVPFAAFVATRNKEYLIAQCKFTVGQLTNVLNYLYDSTLQRIYITQSVANPVYLMQFPYPALKFLGQFGAPPSLYLQQFGNQAETIVTINVPAGIDLSDLTATVAQIALTGILYQIVQS